MKGSREGILKEDEDEWEHTSKSLREPIYQSHEETGPCPKA